MSAPPSGLSERHRHHARDIVAHGCALLLADPAAVHYTQGSQRWEGIDKHLLSAHGQRIHYGDCSSTATWLLWNALYIPYGVRDVVNGENWRAGYTGTIAQHGIQVHHDSNIRVGDLILYGAAPTFEHVTVALGGGVCFSHGGEAGPFKLNIDYRPDRGMVRRVI